MDANACWQRFLDACAEDDHDEAFNAVNDLSNWLFKGGTSPDDIDPETVHNLATFMSAACEVFDDSE